MTKTARELFPDVGNSLTLTPEEKRERAAVAIAALNHKFGREAVQMGGLTPIERIPTGLPCLDLLLRQFDTTTNTVVGYGLPRGRFTMIWGPPDVGKSALLYKIIRQIQLDGGIAAFIDAEHKLDPTWARQNGVDMDQLAVEHPDNLEEVCYSVEKLAQSNAFDLEAIDSVVSIASSAELHDAKGKEFEIDHTTMGVIPKRLSEFFRRANPIVGKSDTAIVLVNQVRMNLGGYVVTQDFPGGHALRHYLTANLKLTRQKTERKPMPERGLTPSHEVTIKVMKGMNESQERSTTFFTECGFDPLDDLVTQLVVDGLITTKGAGRYQIEGKSYYRNDLLDCIEPEFEMWYTTLLNARSHPVAIASNGSN